MDGNIFILFPQKYKETVATSTIVQNILINRSSKHPTLTGKITYNDRLLNTFNSVLHFFQTNCIKTCIFTNFSIRFYKKYFKRTMTNLTDIKNLCSWKMIQCPEGIYEEAFHTYLTKTNLILIYSDLFHNEEQIFQFWAQTYHQLFLAKKKHLQKRLYEHIQTMNLAEMCMKIFYALGKTRNSKHFKHILEYITCYRMQSNE